MPWNAAAGIQALPQTEDVKVIAQYVRDLADYTARLSKNLNTEGDSSILTSLQEIKDEQAAMDERIQILEINYISLNQRVSQLEEGG